MLFFEMYMLVKIRFEFSLSIPHELSAVTKVTWPWFHLRQSSVSYSGAICSP